MNLSRQRCLAILCPHGLHRWRIETVTTNYMYLECRDCGLREARGFGGGREYVDTNWLERLAGYKPGSKEHEQHVYAMKASRKILPVSS